MPARDPKAGGVVASFGVVRMGATLSPASTITTLAPHVAGGLVTASALVERCLDRIGEDDREGAGLHALIRLNPDARSAAEALDREQHVSGVRGPLHGIPIVIKDNIDLRGLPTTSGCYALSAAMPRIDAAQVGRLRDAGAVIIAKTNMAELSFEIRSRSSVAGDVRNPFNTAVTSGGSSGGTAAAIAAGFAYAGLGTDTGGSIRIPAAFCGLVGYRPSWGTVDMAGIAPLAPSADVVGPITRSVADAALIYAVMTARPCAIMTPASRPRRIGVLRRYFGADDEIAAAGASALRLLCNAGFEIIDPVVLPEELLPDSTVDVVDYEFAEAFDAYLGSNFVDGAPTSVAALYASGRFLPDYDATLHRRSIAPANRQPHKLLIARRATLRQAVDDLLHLYRLDALFYPTSAIVPLTLANPASGLAPELAAWTGLPAVTLPTAHAANGIPIGFELLGRADWPLLDVAAEIEAAIGCYPHCHLEPPDNHR